MEPRFPAPTWSDITAVVVTRGDVDLSDVIEPLKQYRDTIVWDDRVGGCSYGCFGRYLAAEKVYTPVIYMQDDDLIFREHEQLLAEYEPGRLVCNMPSPWYENVGYDKIPQALPGAGSLMDKGLWRSAIERYLNHYPRDDLFYDYVDVVVGILTPHKRVDFGYEVLPVASAPGRISTVPGSDGRRAEMQRRALSIRDHGS